MIPLIKCENVAIAYDGVLAVSQLNFSVNKGDYLCIVGPNGSGKTTLLKALLGLKQPCSGKLTFAKGFSPSQIGYLPQQSAAQKDFPGSVWEVVLSGCLNRSRWRPFYTKEEKRLAEEQLRLLNILPLRKSCYRELSGGQQQRVLLARALCATSRLLLLDEPVTGLDPVATRDFYRLIADVNRERKVTVIMVSHDIQSAVDHASHILHLQHQPLFFGSSEEYRDTEFGRKFLGGGCMHD